MSEDLEEELGEEKEKEKGKGKIERKKRKEKGIYSLYKIENNQIARLRPACERCGPGYFMADHGDRYSCGHCGFTRYKPIPEDKKQTPLNPLLY